MRTLNSKNYHQNFQSEKIVLAILPFWTSLIPPIGISCLKGYLRQYGYEVKAIDAAVEKGFRELYERYFAGLKEIVPGSKQGNFFSIGHDVLRNQMMAHLNVKNEREYIEVVKLLINKTFYVEAGDPRVSQLNEIIKEFFSRLETYVVQMLEREKPTVLGLSVFSDTLAASMFVFQLTRERYPGIKTVMGGGVFADYLAQGSLNFEIFLQITQSYIDKIIIGEGEVLLLKLLRGELPAPRRVYTLQDIDWEILDLSSAPVLDLEDFKPGDYPYLVSYTSRSCPFQCSFCSETLQWGKYRKKKGGQIVEELKVLNKQYGCRLFLLSDSLLNPVIIELANEFFKQDLDIYWQGWLRVDDLTSGIENAILWRQSGFYQARLGIESGSRLILDLMGKKITPDQIRATIFSLANVGIKTTTLWVIGHPGETEEDFQQTLDLIEELRDDIYEAECRPFYYYPSGQVGSDYWKEMKKIPLYPDSVRKALRFQTWVLDCQPLREVTYQRVNRFVQHCKQLNIPNPYSMYDIYEADIRWKKLQKNAVPALADLKNGTPFVDEGKNIKKLNLAQTSKTDRPDFIL